MNGFPARSRTRRRCSGRSDSSSMMYSWVDQFRAFSWRSRTSSFFAWRIAFHGGLMKLCRRFSFFRLGICFMPGIVSSRLNERSSSSRKSIWTGHSLHIGCCGVAHMYWIRLFRAMIELTLSKTPRTPLSTAMCTRVVSLFPSRRNSCTTSRAFGSPSPMYEMFSRLLSLNACPRKSIILNLWLVTSVPAPRNLEYHVLPLIFCSVSTVRV